VTNRPLGPAFPHGLFVVQDGWNAEGGRRVNQNFKYVPIERIARPLGLKLDPAWDPRAAGR
jgi:3-phytase